MQLMSFLAVSAVVIVAPGPDLALVGRNALLGGQRTAVLTAIGVVSGLFVWTLAASVGVAALLRRSEPAFVALKVIGAVYLVWLGAQALRAAWKRHDGGAATAATRRDGWSLRALRQGFLSNLGNPKIAVFFTGFLPQFTSSGASFLALEHR